MLKMMRDPGSSYGGSALLLKLLVGVVVFLGHKPL
jgi:hypothetical protein